MYISVEVIIVLLNHVQKATKKANFYKCIINLIKSLFLFVDRLKKIEESNYVDKILIDSRYRIHHLHDI